MHQKALLVEVILGDRKFVNVEVPHAIADLVCYKCKRPIVDLRSFKKVTGPKLERWLTKGVGACLANIGAALGAAGARGKVARELRILGMSTAVSFAAMDLWYAGARRRISRVYLLNGLAQLGFAGLWGVAEWLETRDAHRVPEAAFA